MDRGRIIAVGIFLALAVYMIVGAMASMRDDEIKSEVSETDEQRIPAVPLEELVPRRDEVGTEWRISEPTNITLNATDFIEGIQRVFDKGPSYDRTTVTISLYRLESDENASTYSRNIISNLKTEGGFEEISIGSIDAECYGTYQKLRFWDRATFYCYKDDIYFEVRSAGLINIDNDASDFAKIIASKISG